MECLGLFFAAKIPKLGRLAMIVMGAVVSCFLIKALLTVFMPIVVEF